MLNHLGLAIENHGSSLAEMLTRVEPVSHSVVMDTLSRILIYVHSINDQVFSCFHENLFRVKERFSHTLDLFVVMMVDFTAVVKHVTDIRNSETHLLDGDTDFLEGAIPEATHCVLKVLLNGVVNDHTVRQIGHSMEIESSNEESLNETSKPVRGMLICCDCH